MKIIRTIFKRAGFCIRYERKLMWNVPKDVYRHTRVYTTKLSYSHASRTICSQKQHSTKHTSLQEKERERENNGTHSVNFVLALVLPIFRVNHFLFIFTLAFHWAGLVNIKTKNKKTQNNSIGIQHRKTNESDSKRYTEFDTIRIHIWWYRFQLKWLRLRM